MNTLIDRLIAEEPGSFFTIADSLGYASAAITEQLGQRVGEFERRRDRARDVEEWEQYNDLSEQYNHRSLEERQFWELFTELAGDLHAFSTSPEFLCSITQKGVRSSDRRYIREMKKLISMKPLSLQFGEMSLDAIKAVMCTRAICAQHRQNPGHEEVRPALQTEKIDEYCSEAGCNHLCSS